MGRAPAQAIAAAHDRATPRTVFPARGARGARAARQAGVAARASPTRGPVFAEPVSAEAGTSLAARAAVPWHTARLNAGEPTRGSALVLVATQAGRVSGRP